MVAPPLAGTSHTSRLRFLTFDAVGASLCSCVYAELGYVFSHDLNRAAAYAGRVGTLLAGLAVAGFFMYAVHKLIQGIAPHPSLGLRGSHHQSRGTEETVANP